VHHITLLKGIIENQRIKNIPPKVPKIIEMVKPEVQERDQGTAYSPPKPTEPSAED
jgi:hypothetical protein